MNDISEIEYFLQHGTELLAHIDSGKTLSGVLGNSKESLGALYTVAHQYYNQGKYKEALRLFSFLIVNNQLELKYFFGFGACMQMLNEHQKALKYYGIASLLDLTDPLPLIHSAECYLFLGNPDSALLVLEYAQCQARHCDHHRHHLSRIDGMLELLRKTKKSDHGL